MEEKIIHRLFRYLDKKNIPHTRFEKQIGLSNGYLNIQRTRCADIGEGQMMKIIDNCLDINIEWFITGKGEMFKTNSIEGSNDKRLLSIIESQQRIIENLSIFISKKENIAEGA